MIERYKRTGRLDFTKRKYKQRNHNDDVLASNPIEIKGFSGLLCLMGIAMIVAILLMVYSYCLPRKPKNEVSVK